MEVGFDKEIDALLRKARPNRGVLVGDEPKPGEPSKPKQHLDADSITAFAENALPEKARSMCIQHFADCDNCRLLLSQAVRLNADAVIDESADVRAPAIASVIPWYQGIFRMPNLAFAMGGLVLVFSGILGFLVIRQSDSSKATVSEATAPAERRSGSYVTGQDSRAIPTPSEVPSAYLNTNTSANSAANTASVGAPLAESGPLTGGSGSLGAKPADSANEAKKRQFQIDGASGSENGFVLDGQETTSTKPAAKAEQPAPPSSATTDVTGTGADNSISSRSAELLPKGVNVSSLLQKPPGTDSDAKKAKKEEGKDSAVAKKNEADDRDRTNDLSASAAKAKTVHGGALQKPPVNARNSSDMSLTRTVGGKVFSNRDGAWYDSTYHGQATLNYRRGTDEYKKLDKGLRNIADSVGGTVVIVWKSKAYRIQ